MAGLDLPPDYRWAFRDILSQQPYPKFRPTRYRVPCKGSPPAFWLKSPPSYLIEVYCSTIHVDSALVLLQAREDLRPGCRLEVMFYMTSSAALDGFVKTPRPALITVTGGTAEKL